MRHEPGDYDGGRNNPQQRSGGRFSPRRGRYGHTPYGYRLNPFESASPCHGCGVQVNSRDLVMGRFCSEGCMSHYDRSRGRGGDSGGSSGTTRRGGGGTLHGF